MKRIIALTQLDPLKDQQQRQQPHVQHHGGAGGEGEGGGGSGYLVFVCFSKVYMVLHSENKKSYLFT